MKTYNFGEFCRNEHNPAIPKRKAIVIYSIPFIPMGFPDLIKTMFLNSRVAFIGGVGVFAVSMTILERYFEKQGEDSYARTISTLLSIGMPVIAFGAVMYILSKISAMPLF